MINTEENKEPEINDLPLIQLDIEPVELVCEPLEFSISIDITPIKLFLELSSLKTMSQLSRVYMNSMNNVIIHNDNGKLEKIEIAEELFAKLTKYKYAYKSFKEHRIDYDEFKKSIISYKDASIFRLYEKKAASYILEVSEDSKYPTVAHYAKLAANTRNNKFFELTEIFEDGVFKKSWFHEISADSLSNIASFLKLDDIKIPSIGDLAVFTTEES